jgi:DNA-binding XRE family transcriptional regulator
MTPAEDLAKRKRRQRPPRNKSKKTGRVVTWECRLTTMRDELNLSLRDVATAVGMSVAALHQIEHGTDPMLTTARKLAEFFGTTVEQIWRPLT